MNASNVIEFDGVGLRYGQGPEVLKDVTFSLPSGSFYFLTGESGAGKSSLLSLMYLSRRPTRGHIRMFGKSIQNLPRAALPEIRGKIGVVFQDERFTTRIAENVLIEADVSRARRKKVIDKQAAVLILQSYLDSAARISGQNITE